jgi:diguanylate cyclase (GGDEF)-like protein
MSPFDMPIDPAASDVPVLQDSQQPRRGGWLAHIVDLIVSTDFKQRRCLLMLFLTALLYTVSSALMLYGITIGVIDPRRLVWLAAVAFVSVTAFYIIIRSGYNQRFAEPTLALPQALVAQSLIAGLYAVSGPAHSGTIILMALVMVFGMFNMRIDSTRIVSAYAIGIVGVVMIWRTQTDPVGYPAHLEVINFVLVAIVLSSLSQLTWQLMKMRARVNAQKIALETALAHIQEMATHDELTGLANRRYMMNLMKDHASRRARGGVPFYIAMVDLDHFKSVNDTYGHAVGDEVLRGFAKEAVTILRNTDVVGRWGGEEFLLLLPETPPGEPTIGVARLRGHLGETEVSATVPSLRVAFSAGFARYVEGEQIDQTIERADRALYAAKSAGRSQSVVL